MYIDFLIEAFRSNQTKPAIIWRGRTYDYAWLSDRIRHWSDWCSQGNLSPGMVVSLEADFSPNAVALLLALVERGCVLVPLTRSVEMKKPEFREIAEVERTITVTGDDQAVIEPVARVASHEILMGLKKARRPGLVLLSSGSTGKSKAAVHDFVPILEKFKLPRHCLRTITFLLFDHIGGVNTLLYTLANAGCVVTVEDRSVDTVCRAIEQYQVQLLPTSPTFINLILIAEGHKRYNLSSLETVTYGTEVMPESTLKRFHEALPRTRLVQTYGLSEVGILRAKSKSSDSLWVKVGGEGFETRVADGMLEIKARSAMLGYLNAPSPFTDDGWFKTGDAVEVDGEYIKILGRRSEMINVGGEKVYPAEVESVIQLIPGVEGVTVGGEPNPITGQMVKARVKLSTVETLAEFRKRMRAFCADKLPAFKIPQKVELVGDAMYSERFKKMRNG